MANNCRELEGERLKAGLCQALTASMKKYGVQIQLVRYGERGTGEVILKGTLYFRSLSWNCAECSEICLQAFSS